MYEITDNYCVGGAETPYQVTTDELATTLRAELFTDSDPRENGKGLEDKPLRELLAMCKGGDGQWSADVTVPGCQPSSLEIKEARKC